MKSLACSALIVLLAAAGGFAQPGSGDPYKVLPEKGAFVDQSIMLFKHLSRIAQARAWEREVELARIRNESDWNAYKTKLLHNYKIALGLPFPEKTPLNAEIVRVLDRGDYRIENLIYQSIPDIFVTANLYVPQTGNGPWPGILFPCGHSENGKAYELYHSAALGLVQKGYVVLVYDPPGQGERYQYLGADNTLLLPSPTREHSLLANPLFLMGKHLMALRMWDGMRGIDYLLSRKEVDPDRIGCTGNSGGGTVTLHLVPLEQRIKVAVPVGTVGSPDMELGSGGISDGEQNLPLCVPFGITHADLMMLAWPRPYRLIKESKGGIFRGTRTSFVQAGFLYKTLGLPEKMTYVETERAHGYFKEMREPMYGWFGKWFYGRQDDHAEGELHLEKEQDLLCSKSGQILNERGKAIWQWAAGELEKEFPARPVPADKMAHSVFRDTLLAEMASLLNNPAKPSPPVAVKLGSQQIEGLSVEKLALYSEDDIYLPCLFFKPEGKGKFPVVILADSKGKTSDGAVLARSLAEAGYGVFAVDLRGTGETRITKRSGRDEQGGFEAQTLGVQAGVAYDGLKLGRSIFAMRVHDLLQVVTYLSATEEIDNGRIALIGRSSCAHLALYAAAVDERIKGALADSALVSFSDLVKTKLYTWHFMDFLPRVLRYHDLPQVAGALAPRTLWILNSLDGEKHLAEKAIVENTYQWSAGCYGKLKSGRKLQIRSYGSQQERIETCLKWAAAVF